MTETEVTLDIQQVAKQYTATSQPILSDVSLEVRRGEFVCLLGPSGCGKSTLLNMIAGFSMPTSGDIRFNGLPILGPGRDRAVVFQSDGALYEWLTAEQNVDLPLRVAGMPVEDRRTKIAHYLALVGLADEGGKYPTELSGGMRQRLQLARVLANSPKFLLMDEPFGSLDAQTRRVMQKELGRIWAEERITVVFVTHDIEEAILLADRVLVMSAGPRAAIRAEIAIELPRPRRRDERFIKYWSSIDDLLSGTRDGRRVTDEQRTGTPV